MAKIAIFHKIGVIIAKETFPASTIASIASPTKIGIYSVKATVTAKPSKPPGWK